MNVVARRRGRRTPRDQPRRGLRGRHDLVATAQPRDPLPGRPRPAVLCPVGPAAEQAHLPDRRPSRSAPARPTARQRPLQSDRHRNPPSLPQISGFEPPEHDPMSTTVLKAMIGNKCQGAPIEGVFGARKGRRRAGGVSSWGARSTGAAVLNRPTDGERAGRVCGCGSAAGKTVAGSLRATRKLRLPYCRQTGSLADCSPGFAMGSGWMRHCHHSRVCPGQPRAVGAVEKCMAGALDKVGSIL